METFPVTFPVTFPETVSKEYSLFYFIIRRHFKYHPDVAGMNTPMGVFPLLRFYHAPCMLKYHPDRDNKNY